MATKYFKYRYNHFNEGQGNYTLSYTYNQNRNWYVDNKVVTIKDTLLSDDQYTDESKGKRFGVIEYDETKITSEELDFDLNNDYSVFGYNTLTSAEAISFLDRYTNLKKDEKGYIIQPEGTNLQGEAIEPIYLVIE